MMLTSLLDGISKRVQQKKPLGISIISTAPAVEEFLRLAAVAERFDFGLLPAELIENEPFRVGNLDMPRFQIPQLTKEEVAFWFEGLLPLPAPVCWYEFRVSNDKEFNSTSGLLIKTEDGKVWVQRIEFRNANDYMIDGTWVYVADKDKLIWQNSNKELSASIKRLSNDEMHTMYGTNAMVAIYLTLMINSRSTELRREVPTPRTLALRRQLRKLPLPSHTVVTIVPQRYIEEAREVDGAKGTHASPRIHWRRSHVRVYNRGLPNEYKKVIARMIIGRRELGEVKHDYVVRMKP